MDVSVSTEKSSPRSARGRQIGHIAAVAMSWVWLLGMTACSEPESTAPEAIVIGVIAPIGSEFFRSGTPTANGALLAVEQINAAGGVRAGGHRRPIRLVIESSEDQPEVAVSKAFKLVRSDGAVALVGLTVSKSSLAVAKVAEELQVPMISTASTHPDITRDRNFVFRVIFVDAFQAQVLADLARDELGAQQAAVLFDAGSAYSRGFAQDFADAFRGLGGEINFHESFTTDEPDLSEKLRRVRAQSPDVLVLPVYPSLVSSLVEQVRGSGLEMPILGGDSWTSVSETERRGWGEAMFVDVWSPRTPSDETRAFVEAYEHRFDSPALSYAALAFDAVWLAARAIEQSGSSTPASIRDGLSRVQGFVGATGAIRYEASGDPVRSAVILKIDEDGSSQLFRALDP